MKTQAKNKETFLADAGKLYDELVMWREAHVTASFDELAEQTTVKRQVLMGELLKRLATSAGETDFLADRTCAECGGVLHYKGEKRRTVLHAEGQAVLDRGYYHCDQCGHGFFPPRPAVAVR